MWFAQMQSCNSRSHLSLNWQNLPIHPVGESFHDSTCFPASANDKLTYHVLPRDDGRADLVTPKNSTRRKRLEELHVME